MERLNLLLALAYGVYLFMPLAHLVLHLPGAGAVACLAQLTREPSLWSDCQGPCDDPTHHHAHSRSHAHCLICQTHAHSHALLPTGLSSLQTTDAGAPVAATPADLNSSTVLSSGSIRSPPNAA